MSEAVAEPLAAETDSPAKTNSSTENTDASKSSSGDTSRMPAPDLLRRQMAHCGEYTYQALNKIGKLSPEDTSRISQKYLKVINRTEKQEIEARDVTLELTRALLRYSKTKISHLAFAHQNDTPIEFYNEFPAISEICRLLGCPVIQVSDKDFLTVTSINPFTATAAARLISNEIESECGRKPFHFITTTDLTAWKYTCERHFGT